MANKTVVIDCDPQGNYSVGEEPHEPMGEAGSETGAGDQGEGQIQMQQAKSLDDALNMARDIFSQGDQGGDAATQKAFEGGYQAVAGAPGGM